jgi:hypothetical protein
MIARSCEGKDATSLRTSDLRDDVRRCAKAVQTKPLAIAGEAQRSITDQAGTEERGDLDVRMSFRKRKAEPLVGDCLFGVPAVSRIAGEHGVWTQVLPSASARTAHTAGPPKPGNPDSGAGTKPAALSHTTDDFVPEDERQLRPR